VLGGERPPTALIAGGNQILSGVLRAIREMAIAIPGELSLISCDEIDLTLLMNPPITVISRDVSKTGKLAAEILLRRIAGGYKGEPCRKVIGTELVVRESCARVA